MTNKAVEGKEYRILITSDVHHTEEKKWYGVLSGDRVQLWVCSNSLPVIPIFLRSTRTR